MKPDIESYKWFVCGLIKQMNPRHILEIGLGSCKTTAEMILYNCQEHFEKLFIIELTPNPKAIEELASYPKDKFEIKVGSSQFGSIYDSLKLTDGQNTCDLVLIDGLHTSEGVFIDIKMVVTNNVLKPSGLFVFHDGAASNVRFGIQKAAEEFNLDIFHLPALNISIGKYAL